jgi:hypothetical protein
VTLKVQDMGEPIPDAASYDTVFCFSLDAHVKNKAGLVENIDRLTARTLYLEGHEHTTEKDYENVFSCFRNVEKLGYNEDGIHSAHSTRPFFRCTK